MRMRTFAIRTAKEIIRDPLNLFFGLGFPLVLILLLTFVGIMDWLGFEAVDTSIVYVLFGLLVFLFPGFFLSLIAFLFGGVLLIAGLSQVIGLYQSSKYAPVGGGMYIVPVAITVCGIALFFSPRASTEMLTMIFGAAVALYGISELVAVWKLRKGTAPGGNGSTGDSSQQGEYTDYEEV